MIHLDTNYLIRGLNTKDFQPIAPLGLSVFSNHTT